MTRSDATAPRPRVEGEREREVLAATLDVLADVGYDRLTMDAVATRAKASKATLYRRWNSKVSLVVEALGTIASPEEAPDTGSLREDLRELFCGMGGLVDASTASVLGSVITALGRDPDFAEAFRRDFIAPKIALTHQVWERARARGELRDDIDLELFEPALAGIVLHRVFLIGEVPDPSLVTRVIDQIIVPAAARCGSPHPAQEDSP